MAKQLWNEGRVVGYSAYEIYVKQSQANGVDPVSETEWMSSMLGSGSSLLLKISGKSDWASKATNEVYNIDIPLPSDSKLWSANTIVAACFIGDADWSINAGDGSDSDYKWASVVTSYGPLLDNTAIDHPAAGDIDDNTDLPMADSIDLDVDTIHRLKNYIHIYDGIVMQPGEWKTASSTPPAMDFEPDFSKTGWIRLAVRGPITAEGVYILFTGFTVGAILPGMSGIDGSIGTPDPADGDFLGPAVCPWANKLIFSVPTAYIEYFTDISKIYERKIFTEFSPEVVDSQPIIDIASNPRDYYDTHYNDSTRDYTITRLDTGYDSSASIFTLCDDDDHYTMPALFATRASSNALPPPSSPNAVLYPVDIASPGTVKIFPNYDANSQEQAERYELAHLNTLAFCYDPNTGKIFRNIGGVYHPVASSYTESSSIVVPQDYKDQISPANMQYCYLATTATGTNSSTALSLVDTNGKYLPTAPDAQTKTWDLSGRAICWQDLLLALDTQVQIDLLGTGLRSLRNFSGGTEYITFPALSKLDIKQYPDSGGTSGYRLISIDYHSDADTETSDDIIYSPNNNFGVNHTFAIFTDPTSYTSINAKLNYRYLTDIWAVNHNIPLWDSNTIYYKNEWVYYNTGTAGSPVYRVYRALKDVPTGTVPTNGSEYWGVDTNNKVSARIWDGTRIRLLTGSQILQTTNQFAIGGVTTGTQLSTLYNGKYYQSSISHLIDANIAGDYTSDTESHSLWFKGKYGLYNSLSGYDFRLLLADYTYVDTANHAISWAGNTRISPLTIVQGSKILSNGTSYNPAGHTSDYDYGYSTDETEIVTIGTTNMLMPIFGMKTKLNGSAQFIKLGRWPASNDVTTLSTTLSDHNVTAQVKKGAETEYAPWKNDEYYAKDTIVTYNGNLFKSKVDGNKNHTPVGGGSDTYWDDYTAPSTIKTVNVYHTKAISNQIDSSTGITATNLSKQFTAGFIELPNGLRLYISTSEPLVADTIPAGSIGIGWPSGSPAKYLHRYVNSAWTDIG